MTTVADLETLVNGALYTPWNMRTGTVVPTTDSIALAGGGVELDAVVLYTDLAQSSKLATEFDRRTAAKVVKAFLGCATALIKSHGGEVTSFDGDRVMGVFLGDYKRTNAATCALKINYAMANVIRPNLTAYFQSVQKSGFTIQHATGVDCSTVLAVRAGIRGANDISWIGRAPNFAARLSELRDAGYSSYISAEVFNEMNDTAKLSTHQPPRPMWESRQLEWLGEQMPIYRSNWTWTP